MEEYLSLTKILVIGFLYFLPWIYSTGAENILRGTESRCFQNTKRGNFRLYLNNTRKDLNSSRSSYPWFTIPLRGTSQYIRRSLSKRSYNIVSSLTWLPRIRYMCFGIGIFIYGEVLNIKLITTHFDTTWNGSWWWKSIDSSTL